MGLKKCPKCGYELNVFNSTVFHRLILFCGCGYTDIGESKGDNLVCEELQEGGKRLAETLKEMCRNEGNNG